MMQFVPVDQYYINKKESNDCTKSVRKFASASLSCLSTQETLNKSKLDIVLTNKGHQIYGTWSKTKLLKLLTYKLKQCICNQLSSKKFFTNTISDRRLWITMQSGLYSTQILKTLQKKGMSVHTIIKAMKLGLIRLNCCELFYFKSFKVDPYMLEFKDMWPNKFSGELISNLRATGLSESECWHIIVFGTDYQRPNILYHLLLNGIDVPGIINWQSSVNHATPKIIQFLKHIGIEEGVVQLVEQYGIDEEAEQILINLGLNEMKETRLNVEEIICECNLTMLERDTNSLEIMQNVCKSNSRSTSTLNDTLDFQQCTCQCHFAAEKNTVEELTVQRNDYLRQNIMVPVSWAMAKVLKYEPSDPIHYMVYQLLHWKNNNIIQTKKDAIYEVIALATITMDRKLILRRLLEKEKLVKSLNEKTMENIPCTICKNYQELHYIKQRCWKCINRPARKYKTCELPQLCSSCKIDKRLLKKYKICKFPQMCSSCKINRIDESKKRKRQICKFSQICSSCKINEVDKSMSRKYEICEFPQVCSTCKVNISDKNDKCILLPHLERTIKEYVHY